MKILLLSDSHGRVGNLLEAVEREGPDWVFHMGDLCRDAQALADVYPDLPVTTVAGNCDGWSTAEETERLVELDGVRIFLTHGHCYQAKLGPGALLRAGRERGVAAVVYGHTHEPAAQMQADGLWLINPGTAGGIGNRATYGVAVIDHGQLSVEIKEL